MFICAAYSTPSPLDPVLPTSGVFPEVLPAAPPLPPPPCILPDEPISICKVVPAVHDEPVLSATLFLSPVFDVPRTLPISLFTLIITLVPLVLDGGFLYPPTTFHLPVEFPVDVAAALYLLLASSGLFSLDV